MISSVILAMAGIRERLSPQRIPRGLQGAGITLIIVGLMALAFMGFNGVDSGLNAALSGTP